MNSKNSFLCTLCVLCSEHFQEEYMLEYLDGIECWYAGHDEQTTAHYIEFARWHGLVMTGGSDCHQKPLLLGTLDIPDWVAAQEKLGGFAIKWRN